MDTPYTIFNQKAFSFLNRLNTMLAPDDSGYYIQLEDTNMDNPNNIAHMLKSKTHRRAVVALLKSAEYRENFYFDFVPHMQRIAVEYYKLNGNNLPEVMELEANIDCYADFEGTQRATFNLNTFELQYTTYTVRVNSLFNPLTGAGKLPVGEGEFDFGKFVEA